MVRTLYTLLISGRSAVSRYYTVSRYGGREGIEVLSWTVLLISEIRKDPLDIRNEIRITLYPFTTWKAVKLFLAVGQNYELKKTLIW